METRKIIKLGRSTLVVSLPKYWVKLNELKYGDEICIETQKNGALVVFPSRIKEEKKFKEIEVEVDPTEHGLLIRKVISCYLNGFSKVKLISKDVFMESQKELIRKLCWKLYIRILDANVKEITLQSLADLSSVELDASLRRMANVTLSMYENSLTALGNHDLKLAEAVVSLDDEVDNFCFLLLRLLRNIHHNFSLLDKEGLEFVNCFDYETVVDRLESIADNSVNISKCVLFLHKNKRKLSHQVIEDLISMGREALNLCNMAVKNFFNKNLKTANNIIELKDVLREKLIHEMIIERIFRERDPIKVYASCSVKDSILRIAEAGAEIAEATINRIIRDFPSHPKLMKV